MNKPVISLEFGCSALPFEDCNYIVACWENQHGKLILMGQTEQADTIAPKFTQVIDIAYTFQVNQQFHVEVFKVLDEGDLADLAKQEFVGAVDFPMAHLLNSKYAGQENFDHQLMFALKNKEGEKLELSMLNIKGSVKKSQEVEKQLRFTLSATPTKFEADSEYFFILNKRIGEGQISPIFKSASLKGNEGSVSFAIAFIDAFLLKKKGEELSDEQELVFQLYCVRSDGNHTRVGQASV